MNKEHALMGTGITIAQPTSILIGDLSLNYISEEWSSVAGLGRCAVVGSSYRRRGNSQGKSSKITGRGIDDVRRLGRRLTTFGVVHST